VKRKKMIIEDETTNPKAIRVCTGEKKNNYFFRLVYTQMVTVTSERKKRMAQSESAT
jgi:hypothetical protein